jgi:transposase
VRVTAAFNRLLALPGTTVREVSFEPARITVTVVLRRCRLVCADCQYSTKARYDTRTVDSTWRHLGLGRLRLVVQARLRRLACPAHGVRTEGVPFARPESGFTRDFEDLVAWLATRMDKSAVRGWSGSPGRRSGRSASGSWSTGSTTAAWTNCRDRR